MTVGESHGVSGRGHRVVGAVRKTPAVIAGAARRRDGLAALVAGTVAYLLVYLWAIGDLAVRTGTGTGVTVVDEPFSRALEQAPGTYAFEAVALVEFGLGVYLLSPVNLALALAIAGLVGINLALSYLAITQPKSCGIGAGSGVLAAVPALLAGSACCAPVILIVLGITASTTLLAILPWLLPAGFVLLAASLVYLAGQIDPTVLAT